VKTVVHTRSDGFFDLEIVDDFQTVIFSRKGFRDQKTAMEEGDRQVQLINARRMRDLNIRTKM
jgi:hypothetical protein